MSFRALLLIVLAVPALLMGAAQALGEHIPVPAFGRDYVVRIALDGASDAFVLPAVAGAQDPSLPLVVIDPGHGGRDPGASGGGVREKDVVLAMALRLRELLLEAGGIRVALTREDDSMITLVERPEIARRLDADLFISIHADSAGQSSDVSGASVYTLSNEASSEAAARFAARENSADRLNGVIVEDQSAIVNQVLVELSQGRTQEQSGEFAALIVREGEGRIAFHPSAQRSAALAVLRAPDVPAVLFESGFVTSREDRAKLTTEEGRGAYADVLARAIRVYFARRSDPGALDTASAERAATLAGAR